MRVFLDTEFTDFVTPKLISCGFVAENGSEFYVELADGWRTDRCSEFVVDTVLPLLNQSSSDILSRTEAGRALIGWLATIGNPVDVVYDTEIDWVLIADLLREHRTKNSPLLHASLLSWPGAAMARHFELLLSQTLNVDPLQHHALVDARALQRAVLQTEADFRRPMRPATLPASVSSRCEGVKTACATVAKR